MKIEMLVILLLINWEFVTTLAHLNRDDAKVDTYRAYESLKKAQQSPADVERLYLRTADTHEDDCELYLNTPTPSGESAEDSVAESTFKCRACLADHSWGNSDSNQNGAIAIQNDEFEELLRGSVTWRYLKGHKRDLDEVALSDDNQPVFHCGNELLLIKFSKTRHSNPRLVISTETKWTDSPSQKQCQCIKRNNGSSMLLGIDFKECSAQNWTRGKRMFYSVKVLYFDRLSMRKFSGTATCHSAILPHDVPTTEESPEVICGKAYVIVKLPAKMIKNVKVFDVSRQLPRPVLWKSHHTVFVKVKHSAIEGGILQLNYLDVTGKSQTITVSCVHRTFPFKKAIRKRRQDPFGFILEYDPIPTDPFKPEWAAVTAPVQAIMPSGIFAPSESSSSSIVTTGPFGIPPDARVAEGLGFDLLVDGVNPPVSFETLEPSRNAKTGTAAVDANAECATDFVFLDSVIPTVPFGEFEETLKMTSSAATQPSRITESATTTVDANVEFVTDVDLLDFVIPAVPFGEFDETTKMTYPDHDALKSTTKITAETAVSCNAIDEFNFEWGFSDIPLGPYRPDTTTAATHANLVELETSTPVITTALKTTSVVTTPGLTSTVGTTLAQTTTSAVETTLAQTTTSAAKTTLAQTSAAKTTLAQTSAAGTTLAQTSAAVTTLAQTSAAETTLAQTSAAVTTLAQTTTSAAETTLAQTTTSAAETTLPQTTAAETTLAQTTTSAAETTLAQTTTSAAETTLAQTTTSAAETTLAQTTTSAAETTLAQTTTSAAETTLPQTSAAVTTLAQTTTSAVKTTSAAETTLAQTSAAVTTLAQTTTSAAKTTLAQTSSVETTLAQTTTSAAQTTTSAVKTTSAVETTLAQTTTSVKKPHWLKPQHLLLKPHWLKHLPLKPHWLVLQHLQKILP